MEIKTRREEEPSEFKILGLEDLIGKLNSLQGELTNTPDKEKQKEVLAQMKEVLGIATSKASIKEEGFLKPFSDIIAAREEIAE